jgi:hypothetical protein
MFGYCPKMTLAERFVALPHTSPNLNFAEWVNEEVRRVSFPSGQQRPPNPVYPNEGKRFGVLLRTQWSVRSDRPVSQTRVSCRA